MHTSSTCARKALCSAAALLGAVFSACSKSSSTAPTAATAITQTNVSSAQVGIVGQALQRPLTVMVTDADGNPVAFNTAVVWRVSSADGMVSAATDTSYSDSVVTTTDSYGTASATWMLGATAGTDSLTASVGSISTTFTATAQAASSALRSGGSPANPR